MIPFTRTFEKDFTAIEKKWEMDKDTLLSTYPELARYVPFNEWFVDAEHPVWIYVNKDPNQKFKVRADNESVGDDNSILHSWIIINKYDGANNVLLIVKKSKRDEER